MSVEIVRMRSEHIEPVVNVHMRSFERFFLSFLGPKFLKELYCSFLVDPMGMAFVAVDAESGEVLGSIIGPLRPDGYFKRLLKRRWWAFALASIGAIIRKPTTAKRVLRAALYRGPSPGGKERSLLSSVAVVPEAQGQGIGTKLVAAWAAEARSRGATGCYLTTDAEDNEAVSRFYQKLGWAVDSTYTTPEGRVMKRYVHDFDGNDAPKDAAD